MDGHYSGMADGIQTSQTLTDVGLVLRINTRPILMLSQLTWVDATPSTAVNVFTTGQSALAGADDAKPAVTEPFENIKGQSGLISVTGTVVERWSEIVEEVFGSPNLPLETLAYQTRVITADQVIQGPSGITVSRRFFGGLVNNIQVQYDASGTHIVNASFQMTFTRKRLPNKGPRTLVTS